MVSYEPRGGARLTRGGEQLALHVLRRHRLVELFLVKVLKLDWSEVHAEAEELEHAISDKVLSRIDELLGYPSVDPHGDPIPTARGKISRSEHMTMADCTPGTRVRVARIVDQDPPFLQFLDRCGLTPGVSSASLHDQETNDAVAESVRIRPKGKEPVTVGTAAAGKILVEAD